MRYLFNFILLILIGCGQSIDKKESNLNKEVTDDDIYEIVNFVTKEHNDEFKKAGIKDFGYKYIVDKDFQPIIVSDSNFYGHKLDTIFTKEDFKFIDFQIQKRKNFRFNGKYTELKVIPIEVFKKMFKERDKNPQKSFRNLYEEKFGKDLFCIIGLPLFSKDKKTVFIKFAEMGSSYLSIYKKVNNKWKFCYCVSFTVA